LLWENFQQRCGQSFVYLKWLDQTFENLKNVENSKCKGLH
jgi:hypothetical protein